jgi:hypothetical protein
VAWQVRCHDPVRADEAGDHAQPVGGVPTGPVEQDHRRAVAALQDGGRAQPPLGDREAGDQRPARIVNVGFEHADHAPTRPLPRLPQNHPTWAARPLGGFAHTSRWRYA